MKIKLIVGFRRDQEHSIPADEAHKAYYLFLHPDERGIFSNGLAIKGDQIQEIVPDYQGTMGWNPTHMLDSNDWNELREKGITDKMQRILSIGKEVAQKALPQEMNTPLSQLIAQKYPQLTESAERREGATKSLKELLPKKI